MSSERVRAAGSSAWLALTPAMPLLALVPGGRWVAPLAAPLTLWPSFASAVRTDRRARALGLGLIWAVLLSLGTIALTQADPRSAGRGIWNAEPYRSEMFRWIETGVGKENDPARFVPEHALHLGAFALLAVASGGYLGLVLGAALLAYMNYFVGAFALSAGSPIFGSLVAWVPWAVVRVVAFVAIGSILARPMLVGRTRAFDRTDRRWLAVALAGVLLDVAMKSLLAPTYGEWLAALLSAE